jgi:excisionase family DNA binding protein
MEENEELLTRREAAALLKLSVKTIKRWGKTGKLKDIRLGPITVRVRRSELEALLKAGER